VRAALYGAAMRRLTPPSLALSLAVGTLVAGCGGGGGSETTAPSEPFHPQATLKAVGGTQRTAKPDLVLHVETRPGDANIRSVAVNLPPVVLVDTTAISSFCSEREWKKHRCAGHQKLGFAQVASPAYSGGLSGPVYAVGGSGPLPFLGYVLHGPPEIVLEGKVVSQGGRIQAGVEDLPDVPLKEFQFTLLGGKHGYLVLSTDICHGSPAADATFTSQEGAVVHEPLPLKAACS
jgi:hypothetical protein